MSNDGVQQLWQTERNVCTVVSVSVRTPPLFKAGQNLLNITELVLNVREYCLWPLHDIIWRDGAVVVYEACNSTIRLNCRHGCLSLKDLTVWIAHLSSSAAARSLLLKSLCLQVLQHLYYHQPQFLSRWIMSKEYEISVSVLICFVEAVASQFSNVKFFLYFKVNKNLF